MGVREGAWAERGGMGMREGMGVREAQRPPRDRALSSPVVPALGVYTRAARPASCARGVHDPAVCVCCVAGLPRVPTLPTANERPPGPGRGVGGGTLQISERFDETHIRCKTEKPRERGLPQGGHDLLPTRRLNPDRIIAVAMNLNKNTIADVDVAGKRVLMRVDL